MSGLNGNLLAWSPEDVARFLEVIGFPQMRVAALQRAVTGPQLLSMTPEEIAYELGTTPLQARMIHSEVTKVSSGEFSVHDLESGPAEDPLPGALDSRYNTAMDTRATSGSVQNSDTLDGYNSRVTHPSQIPSTPPSFINAVNTTATIPGVALPVAAVYPPSSPEIVPFGAEKLPTTYEYPAEVRMQPRPSSEFRPVAKKFAYVWQILSLLLAAVAGADLGLSVYMNGHLDSVYGGILTAYANPSSIYSVKYLNGEVFWCALFFAAQSFSVVAGVIILILQAITSFRGSLDSVKNLTFGILIVSLVGLALYALPISKWTYVIATDYSLTIAFKDSAIPAAAFGLSWGAVLLWLIMLILAPVQLAKLAKTKA